MLVFQVVSDDLGVVKKVLASLSLLHYYHFSRKVLSVLGYCIKKKIEILSDNKKDWKL